MVLGLGSVVAIDCTSLLLSGSGVSSLRSGPEIARVMKLRLSAV